VLSLKLLEIRAADTLATHQSAWQALASAAVEPNAFYEPGLLLPALRHLAKPGEIQVLLLFAGDDPSTLCGLFPIHRRRLSGVLGLTVAQLWKHQQAFFTAPLLQPGFEMACWKAVFEWLRSARSGSSLLELTWFPGDGPAYHSLMDYLETARRPRFVREQQTRAVLRPGLCPKQYLESAVSSSRRKKLRRLERELRTCGSVEFRALQPSDDVAAWVDRFLAMEALGWKGQAGTALACCPDEREFFLAAAASMFAQGRFRMLSAELDGRPIAMQCDFLTGDGGFSYKIAFDETYARYSPGMLLELENIRRAHDEPRLRWLDSCNAAGPSPLKQMWREERVIVELFAATGRPQGNLAVSLMPLARTAKRSLRAAWGRLRSCFVRQPPAAGDSSEPLSSSHRNGL